MAPKVFMKDITQVPIVLYFILNFILAIKHESISAFNISVNIINSSLTQNYNDVTWGISTDLENLRGSYFPVKPTLLHKYASEDSFSLLNYLLKSVKKNFPNILSTYVNKKDQFGNTSLHIAAYHNNYKCVKALLKYGADPAIYNDNNCLPLHIAAFLGNFRICQTLIDNNSPINSHNLDGWTPLHCSAFSGNFNIANLLLQNGALTSSKIREGYNAKELAYLEKNQNIAKFIKFKQDADKFINSEFDVNFKFKPTNQTMLMWSCSTGQANIIEKLLKLKSEVDAYDIKNKTPLMYAAHNGDVECINLLIKANANLFIEDMHYRTALDYAVFYGHHKAVSALLNAGAIPTQLTLCYAIQSHDKNILAKLLSSDTKIHPIILLLAIKNNKNALAAKLLIFLLKNITIT